MNNFKPGGMKHRNEYIGGRPKSDANYGTKNRFEHKPQRFNDRDGRSENKEVQLYKATCTTCGKSCEVPFKPNGTKPVLCRDCFASKNPASSERNNDSRPERNFTTTSNSETSALKAQIVSLEAKLTAIMELLKEVSVKLEVITTTPVAAEIKEKPSTKKVAKKSVKKVVKKAKK
jgi:CxxC-x17-CxxC domain-containing protein